MPDSLLDHDRLQPGDAWQSEHPSPTGRQPLGLRLHLVGLLLAALLPVLVASGLALRSAAHAYTEAFEARLRDTARALSLAIDADIGGRIQSLTAFATSPAFGDGTRIADPVGAHAHAGRVAAVTGMRIAVADRDGRFRLHHQVPPGTPLPDSGAAASVLRAAIRQERPVVSDLMTGALVQRPVVAVVVPVPRADGEPPVLSAGGSVDPGFFDAMLAAQRLEPGAFASLVDATGTVIARSDGRFRGRVLQTDIRRLVEDAGGVFRRIGLDGEEKMFSAAALAAAPGWIVTVSVPYAAYRASWLNPVLEMAGGVGLALLVSGGLALLLAGRLLRPLGWLAAHARGVALDPDRQNGTAADLPPVPVAELEALRRGFAAAEAALRRRTEAERRAYATLAEKEAMLATAQQLTGVGGWTWEVGDPAELDAGTLRWTEQTYRIFGLPPGTAISTPAFFAAVPPADRPRLRARLGEALRSGRPYEIEHRVVRSDGSVRIVEELATPEFDGAGRARRVVGSCQDVTERRSAEAALADHAAQLRDLLSTLDLAAFMARDVDGTIRFWSKGCERLFGWTAAEAVGRISHDLLGTVFPVPLATVEAALERDGEWLGELRHRRRDGGEVVVAARKALRRDAAGRAVAVVESVADVTALHAAREALGEREARLQVALDGVGLGIWEQDFVHGRVRLDARATAVIGGLLPADTWVGFDTPEYRAAAAAVHPEDNARRNAVRDRFMAGEAGIFGADYRVKAGGAWRWIAFRGTVLDRDPGTGRARRAVSVVRDATETKEADEALRRSEERLRLALEAAQLGSWEVDLRSGQVMRAGRLLPASAGLPLAGYDVETFFARMVHPDDLDGVRAAFDDLAAGRRDEPRAEYRVRGPDGDGWRWMEDYGGVVERDAATGVPVRLAGVSRDVTERRLAAQALAVSEAEFRATFEQAAVGIAHVALDGGWLRVNDRFCSIAGHTREAMLGLGFRQITHPDDLAADLAQAQALLAGTIDTYAMEKRYIRADGAAVWVNLTVSLLRDAAGRPERFVSVIEDISARRAAEAALAGSEARYRTLFERMEEGFALWEAVRDAAGTVADFRLVERNDAIDRLTGRLPPACIGRSLRTLFPDISPHRFAAHVAAVETGEPQALEEPAGAAGRWLSLRFFRPAPGRVAVLARDVTERVAGEAAVRESEAMLRRVLDNLFSFVGVLAPDGTLLDANRAPLDAAGITLDEVRGQPFWDAYWWSHDPAVAAQVREACLRAAAGEASRYDVEVRMAGDSRMAIDFQVAPLRDEAGRVTHLIPSAVDITARKRSEEAKMLLAREVDHRAKNALAVVQSVLTLTRTEDPAAFKKAVMGRIAAMALAHTLLARESWNGADLRALLGEELAAYRGGGGLEAAVQIDGPLVGLAPGATQAVAMAIHELATNAAKYGGLSLPGGHVSVSWSKDPANGGLLLAWRERGGPPIEAPPGHRGFGTSLIQSTVVRQLQGSLEMRWEPGGLHCVLGLPGKQVRWRARTAPRLG